MIKIKVNDKSLEIEKDFTIQQLLSKIGSPQDGIAVAINDSIVFKHLWNSQTLVENDNILIIQATQGG